MAKRITIGEAEIEELRKAFEDKLKNVKSADGKFKFEKDLGTVNKKAKVVFEEDTYVRMKMLVALSDNEVGWHCLARKVEPSEGFDNQYEVYDIMVYPQEVTGATVNTNKSEFERWLYERPDEEFNNIRFHGHSHVNMGTSPSSVDKAMYEDWLGDLQSGSVNQFYIFSIWNKKGEHWMNIYDLDDNILYESKDIEVKYFCSEDGIMSFISNAKEMVQKKVSNTPSKAGVTYIGNTGYPVDDGRYDDTWGRGYGSSSYAKGYYPHWDY